MEKKKYIWILNFFISFFLLLLFQTDRRLRNKLKTGFDYGQINGDKLVNKLEIPLSDLFCDEFNRIRVASAFLEPALWKIENKRRTTKVSIVRIANKSNFPLSWQSIMIRSWTSFHSKLDFWGEEGGIGKFWRTATAICLLNSLNIQSKHFHIFQTFGG